MSIDGSMHSLFGVSKVAADLMVQEYGRYFDMPTVCFRGGCLTGPAHAGAQLHGFLALPHEVHRDRRRLHRVRLRRQAGARQHPLRTTSSRPSRPSIAAPRAAAVYNLGGGRDTRTARCARRSPPASARPGRTVIRGTLEAVHIDGQGRVGNDAHGCHAIARRSGRGIRLRWEAEGRIEPGVPVHSLDPASLTARTLDIRSRPRWTDHSRHLRSSRKDVLAGVPRAGADLTTLGFVISHGGGPGSAGGSRSGRSTRHLWCRPGPAGPTASRAPGAPGALSFRGDPSGNVHVTWRIAFATAPPAALGESKITVSHVNGSPPVHGPMASTIT